MYPPYQTHGKRINIDITRKSYTDLSVYFWNQLIVQTPTHFRRETLTEQKYVCQMHRFVFADTTMYLRYMFLIYITSPGEIHL